MFTECPSNIMSKREGPLSFIPFLGQLNIFHDTLRHLMFLLIPQHIFLLNKIRFRKIGLKGLKMCTLYNK